MILGLRNCPKNWVSRLLSWRSLRRFVDEYGGFSETYENASEGYDDLLKIAKELLETKVKLDFFMDTLPKKQQAIYAQSIEDRKKAAITEA